MSLMADEIAQIPSAAATLLTEGAAELRALAEDIKGRNFTYVIICGRGSSGHAGVYLRYLIETIMGYGVSASAPSVITGYRTTPKMRGALFIVISQSGRSPDLIAATNAAREGGAFTLALVNDASSPVALAAHRVLPIHAGEERSVAATKTVVNSMLAGALLIAQVAGDEVLRAGLNRMPERLASARALDWSAWGASLQNASAAYVTGRGHGFGPAREIALKISETLRLPALAYSSAELRHGPRAALGKSTPVLVLRQNDAVSLSIDELAADLQAASLPVFMCGGNGALPWLGDDHPACDPVTMMVPAYSAIEREAVRRGYDPDKPVGLKKVTETL
jgi:glucosamine--fructose-6-phosphate aminotransferase (isomerizing)